MEHAGTVEVEYVQSGFDSHDEYQRDRGECRLALTLDAHVEVVELGLVREQRDAVGELLDRQVEEVGLHLNLQLRDHDLREVRDLQV